MTKTASTTRKPDAAPPPTAQAITQASTPQAAGFSLDAFLDLPSQLYQYLWTEYQTRIAATPALAPAGDTGEPVAAPDPAPAAPAKDGTEIDANLKAADEVAANTSVPHTYSAQKALGGPIAGDPSGEKRRDALTTGNTAAIKSVVCSEFTVLELQKAGVDLNQRYVERSIDPPLPVAYTDANGFTFIDLYMVTNNMPEAAASILAAQHGKAERVEPGSDRAKQLKTNESTAFLHFSDFQYKKVGKDEHVLLAPEEGDHFGAGATALSLGGKQIAEADRRPGDVQQRWDTTAGQTLGAGHSSTVYTVRGKGVAYVGAAGAPRLVPAAPYEIPPGWYTTDELYWEIGPETDPQYVAKIDVDYVQLIEANEHGLGDATPAGKDNQMKLEDTQFDPAAASSKLTSTGRLPGSKWLHDPTAPGPILGKLTKTAIVPAG